MRKEPRRLKASTSRSFRGDWLLRAPGDVERIEARLSGVAYDAHRHDTYAVGITLEGVQTFDYRGATRCSRPSQLVVLHPDEVHDGRAGDGDAFRYRTAYLAPAELQRILGGAPLPFIEGGVSSDPRLRDAVRALLEDYEVPLTGLACQDALYDVVTALQAASGVQPARRIVDRDAAFRARQFIDAHVDAHADAHAYECVSLESLERETSRDRWQLSRDFRCLFGTSPHRYLTLRRLDRARSMLLSGRSGAECASTCGFADQSHFCRLFRKAFGLTPNAWLRVQRRSHDRSIRT